MNDSTIVCSLFGTFARHPHLAGGELAEDPYSMLVNRAESFGWDSVHSSAGARPTLWAMHEAAESWVEASEPTNVAWFQVGLDAQRAGKRPPLPLAPLLACALQSARRVGQLGLTGLQVLAPIHLAGDATDVLHAATRWFTEPAGGPERTVRVTLDAGPEWDVVTRKDEIAETLSSTALRDLIRKVSPTSSHVAQTPSPAAVWLGTREHRRASFELTVTEWGDDAAATLVVAAVEACRRAGVRTSVLVDVAAA